MADIKLIATDLDGTFLMNGEDPHPENVKALKACQDAGIIFCACTGRLWYEAKAIVVESGFDDFCVTNNGASIIDIKTEEHRFRSRIDPLYLRQILEVAIDYGAAVMVSGFDSFYAYGPLLDDDMRSWMESMENKSYEYRTKTYVMSNLDDLVEVCKYSAEKIDVHINVVKYIDEVYERLSKITDVEITSAWVHGMEITAKGGNKAEALSVIADIYDVSPDNIMTLGDSFNDISMVMWAGTGVAMGNADDRLKSVANYVSTPNYEAGVAKAIYDIVLK